MAPTPAQKIITYLILLICLITLAAAVWIFLGGFDSVKPVIDSLAADGEVESFTTSLFSILQIAGAVFSVLALLITAAILFFREKVQQALQSILDWLGGIRRLGPNTRAFFHDFASSFPDRGDLIYLLILVILGAVLRGLLTNIAMGHDESYTYVAFARKDLGTILRDYHLPNNHVFHTILVHFSTMLFGSQPWAVRLPAMLSVLGIIPLGYLLGRHYFNRRTGLLLAAAAALLPDFILTSLNARGYPVVTFLLIAVWLLAIYLKGHNNLFAWFVFIITAVLGFFTLPMMLYGFGMVLGWLFVSWLFSDISSEYSRWAFLRGMFLAGLAVVVLTAALYTPILLHNGAQNLIAPPVVQQLKVHNLNLLSEDLITRVGGAWLNWHTGFAAWFAILTLIGAVWALIRFRRISPHAVSAFGVGIVWILALLVIQMIVGWTRIWFFLAPVYFMYAFAGWLDLLDFLTHRISKPAAPWLPVGLILLVLVTGSAGWLRNDSRVAELLGGSKSYNQVAAEYIAAHSDETDLIVVISPDSPIIWYYCDQLGIPTSRFNLNSGTEFTHALLLVNTAQGQTVDTLLDSKSLIVPDNSAVELVFSSSPMEVYFTSISNLVP